MTAAGVFSKATAAWFSASKPAPSAQALAHYAAEGEGAESSIPKRLKPRRSLRAGHEDEDHVMQR